MRALHPMPFLTYGAPARQIGPCRDRPPHPLPAGGLDSGAMSSWSPGDLLPGAWVALVAVLGAYALGRWYERPPRRVLALFAVATALLFGAVLFGGRVLLPLDNLRGEAPLRGLAPTDPHGNLLQGDLIHLVLPLRMEVRRALATGAWPLWSPRLGAGMPLLADPQSQALQPLVVAVLPLEATAAPGALAALRTFAALVFAFLLLRRLGAGAGPASAGALAYGLGGFLQLWLGWPLANAAVWLPALLWALVLADERGLRRDWALVAGCAWALLLAGQPAAAAYSLAVAAGLAGLRLRARPAGRRGRYAARLAAALALAALLAAPALLPFAQALPDSLRWARLGPATPAGSPAARDAAAGAPAGDLAAGASQVSLAAGPREQGAAPATRVVQTVAPKAFGDTRYLHYWGHLNSNEDAAGFVGTAALLAALLALPGWLAGPRPVRHELAALGLAGLCLVLLALPGSAAGLVPAAGLSGRLALPLDLALAAAAAATLERFRRPGLPRWMVYGALPAAVAVLALAQLAIYRGFADLADPSTLQVLRRGWLLWHLRFLAVAALALFLGRFPRRRGGGGRRIVAWGVALAIGAELFLISRPINPPMPRRLDFPEVPSLAFLRAAAGTGPGGPRIAASGTTLLPNLAAVYGLADVRVFDPMAPAPYMALLSPAIAEWAGEIPRLRPGDSPLYDPLAVEWLLVAREEGCPEGTAAAFRGPDAVVCRRPGAHPLLRLVGGPPVVAARVSGGGDGWRARLAAPAGGLLATALYDAPGWRVLADGRPAPGRRLRGALLGAWLPPGAERLDLVYRPCGFLAGCLLAALGLAAGLAWAFRPPAAPIGPPDPPGDRLGR